jgi:hypothetical protein
MLEWLCVLDLRYLDEIVIRDGLAIRTEKIETAAIRRLSRSARAIPMGHYQRDLV